jgi:hypothetical protein
MINPNYRFILLEHLEELGRTRRIGVMVTGIPLLDFVTSEAQEKAQEKVKDLDEWMKLNTERKQFSIW